MARLTMVHPTRHATHRSRLVAAIAVAMGIAGGSAGAQTRFIQTNLVSNIPGLANVLDPQLVNPWGISSSSTSPFWVSDNTTGLSTLYDGTGAKQGLVVTIPGGSPTGQVFNGTGSFLLSDNANATFLFASQNGSIYGWNGGAGTTALVAATGSGTAPQYTGLAISGSGASARLYGANFGNGSIDVFDGSFTPVLSGGFNDPMLPSGYSPFNVQALNGAIFVAYALIDPATGDEVHGAGLGAVDMYDVNGNLLRRVVSTGGALNAPWGMAIAPSTFGGFAGDLLVGNFGDGTINAYLASNSASIGQLQDPTGAPIFLDGLWGLIAGNGGKGGSTGNIYFAAGLNDEADGLFGSLSVSTPEPGTLGLLATGLGVLFAAANRRRRRASR